MTPTKSVFSSKTIWFNVIAGLLQVLPGIAPMVPQPWGSLVTALVNIGLRYVSTGAVSLSGS